MDIIMEIYKTGVPIVITVGVLMFVYGLISLIFVKDGQKRKSRKKIMWWGFAAAFLALLVWFVVAVTTPTLGPEPVPQNLMIPEDRL